MTERNIQDYTGSAHDYDVKRYLSQVDSFIDNIRKEKLSRQIGTRIGLMLDVATGTGSGIFFSADRAKKVIGLDGTLAMLNEASKKISRAGLENVSLVQGNAMKLPFNDETFDTVISLNFLHLFTPVKRQEPFVQEMSRVVKTGGSLIVEIDNALECGILGLVRKYFGKDIGYNWPWDVFSLAKGMKLESIDGITLAGTKKLSAMNRGMAKAYSNLASVPPFIFLADRLIIKYRKL